MLPDSLVNGDLGISDDEREALESLITNPGMEALRKVLWNRVLMVEGQVFSLEGRSLDDAVRRSLIELRRAYYDIASFLTPRKEGEEDG